MVYQEKDSHSKAEKDGGACIKQQADERLLLF